MFATNASIVALLSSNLQNNNTKNNNPLLFITICIFPVDVLHMRARQTMLIIGKKHCPSVAFFYAATTTLHNIAHCRSPHVGRVDGRTMCEERSLILFNIRKTMRKHNASLKKPLRILREKDKTMATIAVAQREIAEPISDRMLQKCSSNGKKYIQ